METDIEKLLQAIANNRLGIGAIEYDERKLYVFVELLVKRVFVYVLSRTSKSQS